MVVISTLVAAFLLLGVTPVYAEPSDANVTSAETGPSRRQEPFLLGSMPTRSAVGSLVALGLADRTTYVFSHSHIDLSMKADNRRKSQFSMRVQLPMVQQWAHDPGNTRSRFFIGTAGIDLWFSWAAPDRQTETKSVRHGIFIDGIFPIRSWWDALPMGNLHFAGYRELGRIAGGGFGYGFLIARPRLQYDFRWGIGFAMDDTEFGWILPTGMANLRTSISYLVSTRLGVTAGLNANSNQLNAVGGLRLRIWNELQLGVAGIASVKYPYGYNAVTLTGMSPAIDLHYAF